jgi:hypothetical protein
MIICNHKYIWYTYDKYGKKQYTYYSYINNNWKLFVIYE